MGDCNKKPGAPYADHVWGTVGSNVVCLRCDVLEVTVPKNQAEQIEALAALLGECLPPVMAAERARNVAMAMINPESLADDVAAQMVLRSWVTEGHAIPVPVAERLVCMLLDWPTELRNG